MFGDAEACALFTVSGPSRPRQAEDFGTARTFRRQESVTVGQPKTSFIQTSVKLTTVKPHTGVVLSLQKPPHGLLPLKPSHPWCRRLAARHP